MGNLLRGDNCRPVRPRRVHSVHSSSRSSAGSGRAWAGGIWIHVRHVHGDSACNRGSCVARRRVSRSASVSRRARLGRRQHDCEGRHSGHGGQELLAPGEVCHRRQAQCKERVGPIAPSCDHFMFSRSDRGAASASSLLHCIGNRPRRQHCRHLVGFWRWISHSPSAHCQPCVRRRGNLSSHISCLGRCWAQKCGFYRDSSLHSFPSRSYPNHC